MYTNTFECKVDIITSSESPEAKLCERVRGDMILEKMDDDYPVYYYCDPLNDRTYVVEELDDPFVLYSFNGLLKNNLLREGWRVIGERVIAAGGLEFVDGETI